MRPAKRTRAATGLHEARPVHALGSRRLHRARRSFRLDRAVTERAIGAGFVALEADVTGVSLPRTRVMLQGGATPDLLRILRGNAKFVATPRHTMSPLVSTWVTAGVRIEQTQSSPRVACGCSRSVTRHLPERMCWFDVMRATETACSWGRRMDRARARARPVDRGRRPEGLVLVRYRVAGGAGLSPPACGRDSRGIAVRPARYPGRARSSYAGRT